MLWYSIFMSYQVGKSRRPLTSKDLILGLELSNLSATSNNHLNNIHGGNTSGYVRQNSTEESFNPMVNQKPLYGL